MWLFILAFILPMKVKLLIIKIVIHVVHVIYSVYFEYEG